MGRLVPTTYSTGIYPHTPCFGSPDAKVYIHIVDDEVQAQSTELRTYHLPADLNSAIGQAGRLLPNLHRVLLIYFRQRAGEKERRVLAGVGRLASPRLASTSPALPCPALPCPCRIPWSSSSLPHLFLTFTFFLFSPPPPPSPPPMTMPSWSILPCSGQSSVCLEASFPRRVGSPLLCPTPMRCLLCGVYEFLLFPLPLSQHAGKQSKMASPSPLCSDLVPPPVGCRLSSLEFARFGMLDGHADTIQDMHYAQCQGGVVSRLVVGSS